jgi:hypothetical protein
MSSARAYSSTWTSTFLRRHRPSTRSDPTASWRLNLSPCHDAHACVRCRTILLLTVFSAAVCVRCSAIPVYGMRSSYYLRAVSSFLFSHFVLEKF